ncbi:hypothetical protein GE09DRAFT_1171960 [Coniochaeta sp. 2T2.1]|nr:hypothetical protein GE09DRAFT_1171960 [Coniochaeta sp. 2T2.1]
MTSYTPVFKRQQQTLPLSRSQTSQSPAFGDRSSTPSSVRALRRTPRFHGTPSPQPSEQAGQVLSPRRSVHLEAASVGISRRPVFATAAASPELGARPPLPRAENKHRRHLSQDLLDDTEYESTLNPSYIPPRTSSAAAYRSEQPHRIVRISRGTHSAILWALEEALRQPNPFSPDLVEENDSMADLLGGGGPASTNGNSASVTRPTAPPQQTGSPGIRGPRMIMRERAEREARQKAEREQMEGIRTEEEARALEEQRRRAAERRGGSQAAGAAVGGKTAGAGVSAAFEETQADPMTQRRQQRAQEAAKEAAASRQTAPIPQAQPLRATRVPTGQPEQAFTGAPPAGAPQGGSNSQPGENPATGAATTRMPRNSFPHAFERWEALSAHWEGMTSFWIRKLQENTVELDRNPVSAQLSRQVSDLSAAGANLFHAVVELQRLRASSERKFQRWFFETRAELERNQETNAMLQKALDEERQGRADAIREALEHNQVNSKTQKQLDEMRKELVISKEEARRAWEELGRRQEWERERTASLQQGLPTIIGGVQVVPMTQGVPSRQTSARDPQRPQTRGDDPDYGSSSQTTGVYPAYTQPAVGVPPGDAYYQQQPPATTAQETGSHHGPGSEGGYSEGEFVIDGQGNYVRDAQGNKIPYRSPEVHAHGRHGSDASVPEDFEPLPASTTSYPPSSSQWAQSQQDYAGQGYAAPGWETVPRHHHPTRLSDVFEEDEERSRTSASQVSRVSRA